MNSHPPLAATAAAPKGGTLSDPNVRRYLLGQLGSSIGSTLQGAVLALLVLSLTRKEQAATVIGLVNAFGLLPGVILGPFAGILLDRWNKRNILITTAVLGGIQATALTLLTYTGHINIWWIYTLSLLLGLITAIDGNGRNAILKDIVANPDHVKQASKLVISLYTVAQVIGPGVAGYLVLTIGYSGSFLLNVLSYVGLVVALLNIHMIIHYVPPTDRLRIWRPVVEGAKHVFSHPEIRLCTILMMTLCLFVFPCQLLMSVIAKYMLHGDAILYSHLSASYGCGSLTGGLLTIVFNTRLSHKNAIVGGMTVAGTFMILLSLTTNTYWASICLFFVGAGFVSMFSALRGSLTHVTERRVMGIVGGWSGTMSYGGLVLASLTMGPLADKVGCPTVLACCGVVTLGVAAVAPFLKGINKL
ncbi:MAG: hypothetical protein RJB39_239 [Candidatus Parcubacteria bacterium]|jgi:MFS family permease